MSDYVWCHGPSCHTQHTQDRIRGVKGSKVLRTKKIKQFTYTSSWYSSNNLYNYFCSQGCYNDFANHKYVQQSSSHCTKDRASGNTDRGY